jgi:hypothetical protein
VSQQRYPSATSDEQLGILKLVSHVLKHGGTEVDSHAHKLRALAKEAIFPAGTAVERVEMKGLAFIETHTRLKQVGAGEFVAACVKRLAPDMPMSPRHRESPTHAAF